MILSSTGLIPKQKTVFSNLLSLFSALLALTDAAGLCEQAEFGSSFIRVRAANCVENANSD